MSTLLLITSTPTSVMAWHAFGLAQALHNMREEFRVFFYQDGVQVANDLQWFPDDQRNLKQEWQKLGIRLLSVSVLPLPGYHRCEQCTTPFSPTP